MSEAIATKLDEARALIEKGWCQGDYAYADGNPITEEDWVSADCDSFCSVGAIHCTCASLGEGALNKAIDIFQRAIGTFYVPDWNDNKGRTQAEVIEAFRKAAELARQEQAA